MGAYFKLEHANIVAFLTSPALSPPRLRRRDLSDFIQALMNHSSDFVISQSEFWPREIRAVAGRAHEKLSNVSLSESGDELLRGGAVGRVLEELRSHLSDFPLFALAVGDDRADIKSLEETARALAFRTYDQALILIPEVGRRERNLEVLDPLPAFSTALHAAGEWPGFLFWTQTGVSAFASLSDLDELIERLQRVLPFGSRPRPFPFPYLRTAELDDILRQWRTTKRIRNRRILHLSDLHFGTDYALENQGILDGELHEVVKTVDRVVITGDLFDSPKAHFAQLFKTFKHSITRIADGKEPIVITGNHDQRIIGIIGDNYKQIAGISSAPLSIDEKAQIVFVCFNSSVGGRIARGQITKTQFRNVGGEYRSLLAGRPELRRFLPVVLVHHHPFSFETVPETWVQKALSLLGLSDEKFMEMKDAADLHKWCADWNISTVLHGHKHKARYVEKDVGGTASPFLLTAIGCGSSLGAEGSPVSYNILEWDETSQKWIASFFESRNGGAFKEIIAAISPPRNPERRIEA